MEPVFMILAQSAATGACLALDHGSSLQHLNYADLRAQAEVGLRVGSAETDHEARAIWRERHQAGVLQTDDPSVGANRR